MYAVIETGGKQYRVKEGDVIVVEKLKAEVGEKVEFDRVLCLGEGDKVAIGQPYLDSAVTGQIVENGKGEKVIIFKYKSKKDYRKKQGHRQPFSKVEILTLDGKPTVKREAPKASAPAKKAEDKPQVPKGLKQLTIHDFQFYPPRLVDLQEKELAYYRKQIGFKAPLPSNKDDLEDREAEHVEQHRVDLPSKPFIAHVANAWETGYDC